MLNSSASNGWFSGVPSVIEYGDAIIEEGPNILSGAIDTTIKEQTQRLRSQAQHNSTWRPYADHIYVEYDEKNQEIVFTVQGSPQVIQGAMVAEYGNGKAPPTGFLRKHAVQHTDIESYVNRYIGQVMG